ncbi:MAG TPA: hypothetical protein VK163_15125 [Opitutaceae bacterium]|nr:hypothetical protein [Opitutaceae bacterium]
MKHILSSTPLLVTAVAILTVAVIVALNLRIVTPETLGCGAGVFTSAGLLAMLGLEAPSRDYC